MHTHQEWWSLDYNNNQRYWPSSLLAKGSLPTHTHMHTNTHARAHTYSFVLQSPSLSLCPHLPGERPVKQLQKRPLQVILPEPQDGVSWRGSTKREGRRREAPVESKMESLGQAMRQAVKVLRLRDIGIIIRILDILRTSVSWHWSAELKTIGPEVCRVPETDEIPLKNQKIWADSSHLPPLRLTTSKRQLGWKALPDGSPSRTQSLRCGNIRSSEGPELPDHTEASQLCTPRSTSTFGSWTPCSLLLSSLLCGFLCCYRIAGFLSH